MENIRWKTIAAVILGIILTTVVAGGVAWIAIYGLGSYGWAVFVGVPIIVGYVAVALYRFGGPKSLLRCIGIACVAALALSLGFLVLGWEGIICIVMAIPLGLPLVILGACLGYLLLHKGHLRPILTSTMVVVFVVGVALTEAKLRGQAPVFSTSTSLRVEASPAVVWEAIIRLERLPDPDDWFFRMGVACPQTARIESAQVGGLRVCMLSTGQLIERIEVWQPERQLRWRSLTTPPPMRELNPFRAADPPHLHGFYNTTQGEFTLQPLEPTATLVTRRTWYQHNLYPAQYWRLWCDFAAEKIHIFVLQQVKRAAESRGTV